ncbi:MAG: hypothetical protein WDA16_11285 [Candidatus Thermoplasmatota archaeon]
MDDDGHLIVIEALLFATLLLGAATYVTLLKPAAVLATDNRLAASADDALFAIVESMNASGESPLDALVRHASICALAINVENCLTHRPPTVDARLRAYLAPGTFYDLYLSNGIDKLPLGPASSWSGPAVGASIVYAPQGYDGIVVPWLSCHATGSPFRADAVFVRAGNPRTNGNVIMTLGAQSVAASQTGSSWVGEFAAPTDPGTIRARWNSSAGEAMAEAPVSTCDLSTLTLQNALASVTLEIRGAQTANPFPGGDVVLSRNISALAAVEGVSVLGSRVDIYSPLPNNGPLLTLTGDASNVSQITWSIPANALYGCYPTVLRVSLHLALTTPIDVEASRASVFCVALASGHVPFEPLYRVHLRVWMPEMGE